jgi:DhnA family fructose-bisphosphate aldolase class Ia
MGGLVNGTEFRLGRLFNRSSGRSFVAAIDHGLTIGPQPGAVNVLKTIDTIVNCKPDAILISPGVFARTSHLFAFREAPSAMLRTDFFINREDPRMELHEEQYRVLCSPTYAASLGADSIIHFLILQPGTGQMFADNARAISVAAEEAHRIGLPLIVEVVTWGSQVVDKRNADLLSFGCRMAAELGADAVKTEWTGNVESMRQVVDVCPVPTLVLGGAKSESPEALYEVTTQALVSGAKGVIYGRNIWQAEDPSAVAAQIRGLIHGSSDSKSNELLMAHTPEQ